MTGDLIEKVSDVLAAIISSTLEKFLRVFQLVSCLSGGVEEFP